VCDEAIHNSLKPLDCFVCHVSLTFKYENYILEYLKLTFRKDVHKARYIKVLPLISMFWRIDEDFLEINCFNNFLSIWNYTIFGKRYKW